VSSATSLLRSLWLPGLNDQSSVASNLRDLQNEHLTLESTVSDHRALAVLPPPVNNQKSPIHKEKNPLKLRIKQSASIRLAYRRISLRTNEIWLFQFPFWETKKGPFTRGLPSLNGNIPLEFRWAGRLRVNHTMACRRSACFF